MIQALVFTDGRRDCLNRTLESWRTKMRATDDIDWLIVNDCLDPVFAEWLEDEFPWAGIAHTATKLGFCGTVQRGWGLVPVEADYVLHLEDDFVLNDDLDLDNLLDVLDNHPHLAQLVLKRQSWGPAEERVGGIVEQWPDCYEDKTDGLHHWAEHRLFWSTNPSIYQTRMLDHGWPDPPACEGAFTQKILDDSPDWRFAFWGRKTDPPRVHHIGDERVGNGY